jgi:wyosine [tRNA(Phe)-imidazoG37] synthetase (radical SAM superfamily)
MTVVPPEPIERETADVGVVFGPVPSRRLGRSLGINNIPPKHCPYSCVYCQVGLTGPREILPRPFLDPDVVVERVEERVAWCLAHNERIDYLTFVPDGEPTLDANLGREIGMLQHLGIPIAVISNGSLAWSPDVRAALREADWVSVKVDAVEERTWRRIDRPHPSLALGTVIEGIRELAEGFPGSLVSETMLVEGVNDDPHSVDAVARVLGDMDVSIAYLAIPTRPPAVAGARGPDERVLARAHRQVARRVRRVEFLVAQEGDDFAVGDDVGRTILDTAAVHPLRRATIRHLLQLGGEGWDVVDRLVREGALVEVEHEGSTFYVRRFRRAGGTLRSTSR